MRINFNTGANINFARQYNSKAPRKDCCEIEDSEYYGFEYDYQNAKRKRMEALYRDKGSYMNQPYREPEKKYFY